MKRGTTKVEAQAPGRSLHPVVGHSPENCRAAYAIHKSELGPVAECHFIKRGRGYTVEMNYEDGETVFYSLANAQKHFWFFGWIMSNPRGQVQS